MSETKKQDFFKSDAFKMFVGKYGIGAVLIAMMIIIAVLEPAFVKPTNLINVATQISINGLLTYGMCLAITTLGIDLSVGAQLTLTSVILAVSIQNGFPVPVAVVFGLLTATGFGLLNGILIANFDMAGFVATLSTQLIIRGIAQVISGGKAVPITAPGLKAIYTTKLFGFLPVPIFIFIVITIFMYILLHWTKFGRYIFAVGGNMNAAIASGVNKNLILRWIYTISGFLAGVASVIYTSKVTSGQSNFGIGYETDAVAASVLGGTSFVGGIATIPGDVLGIFIIGFIYNGMNMIGVSSYYQVIVKGCVILGAVMLDHVMSGKQK